MGVITPLAGDIPILWGALTADGRSDQLDLFRQAAEQQILPSQPSLQKYTHIAYPEILVSWSGLMPPSLRLLTACLLLSRG